ncbi:MAG: aminomethyl-transferring glycine dehydrogenase subunit GcvPA [Patescibacteria group bacterium]
MPYVPHSTQDQKEMLAKIGVTSVRELFSNIPAELMHDELFDLPEGLSEQETRDVVTELSEKNKLPRISFMGGGAYRHYIPSVVPHLAFRSEFYTAYTPYQPEISQGILQAIFEYQTLMCRVTGMEVCNASMYDGSSAAGETCIMAANITGRSEILVSKTVNPQHREVMRTYCKAKGLVYKELDYGDDGQTSAESIQANLSDKTAGIFIQSPNFFGSVEDVASITNIAHTSGALSIQIIAEAMSLGLLKPPGEMDVDIAIGDGQSFGVPVSFGGPYVGFMTTKEKYVRQIPGRLVGETVDTNGKRAFVLTLQAREQHIRREKASSNICTNQALVALMTTIYLSSVGKKLKDLALLNYEKAHRVLEILLERHGSTNTSVTFAAPNGSALGHVPADSVTATSTPVKLHRRFPPPCFNEFVLEIDRLDDFYKRCLDNGIVPGLKLEQFYPELKNCLLVCATEVNKLADVEEFSKILDN